MTDDEEQALSELKILLMKYPQEFSALDIDVSLDDLYEQGKKRASELYEHRKEQQRINGYEE